MLVWLRWAYVAFEFFLEYPLNMFKLLICWEFCWGCLIDESKPRFEDKIRLLIVFSFYWISTSVIEVVLCSFNL